MRLDYWTSGISIFSKFPLFGIGVIDATKMRHIFGIAQLHNSLINILLWSGLIGLLLYSSFISSLVRFKKKREFIEDYKLLIGLFVSTMVVSLFDGIELHQSIYLFYMILYNYNYIIEAGNNKSIRENYVIRIPRGLISIYR